MKVMPFHLGLSLHFLMFNHSDLASSDLSNYKNTNAYSYFNQIGVDVILVTEYMKVVDFVYLYHMNNTPHIVWVSIWKIILDQKSTLYIVVIGECWMDWECYLRRKIKSSEANMIKKIQVVATIKVGKKS